MIDKKLFEKAKEKEKISKLPFDYDVVRRGHVYTIKTGYISCVWIGKQMYKISLFEIDDIMVFKDMIDFQLFIFDNFYKITKIYSDRKTVSYEYFLKKGFLHNSTGSAVRKFDNKGKIIIGEYYLNGREIDTMEYKKLLREKKLKRIVEKYDIEDE